MEISIRDILARHATPGLEESNIRHTVAKVITELSGVTVTPSQITHTEGNLSLSVPPVLKSALLVRYGEFQERLKNEGIEIGEIR